MFLITVLESNSKVLFPLHCFEIFLDAQSIDDEKAKKKKGFFASLRCLIPSKFTNKKKNQRLSEELTIKNNNTDCPTPEKQRIFSEGSRFSFSVKSPNDKVSIDT